MNTILLSLPCLVCVFWVVLLFFNRKENTRSQNIWILCLLMMGISCFVWGELFINIEDYSLYYKLDILDIVFSLSIFPMLYIYFWSLTNSGKLTWKQYIWFAPALIIGGMASIFYILMGEEQSADFIRKVIESYESYRFEPGSLQSILSFVSLKVFYPLVFLQAVVIMTYATLNLIRYKRGLKNFFSNLDQKSIENNRAVLIGVYVFLFLAFLTLASRFFSTEKYFSVKYFFMTTAGISIYFMSYHVYKMRYTNAEILIEEAEKEPSQDSEASHDIYKKILPQFMALIDEDKIFLQPNLSLDDIARRINSNRTYISRIINEEFQSNFYDFINGKRIDYAKTLIVQNPLYTQEQIAKESGFLHAPNFSRAFKEHAGMTFREWRNLNCL